MNPPLCHAVALTPESQHGIQLFVLESSVLTDLALNPTLAIYDTRLDQNNLPFKVGGAHSTAVRTDTSWIVNTTEGELAYTTSVTGEGLTYDLAGNLSGGTIHGVQVIEKAPGELLGDLLYRVGDGFSVDVASFDPETGLTGLLEQGLAQGANIAVPVGAVGTTAAVHGYAGDDYFLAGGLDLETLNVEGGAGIDTMGLVHVQNLSSLTQTAFGWSLQDFDTQINLANVERVQGIDPLNPSNNISRALDLDGNAGQAARLLGALAGADALQNEALVGEAISYVDTYGIDGISQQLVDWGVVDSLAGGTDSASLVTTLFENIAGTAPSQAELDEFTGYIDSGVWTKADALDFAAGLDQTAQTIDLVGLSQTGLEFTPFG